MLLELFSLQVRSISEAEKRCSRTKTLFLPSTDDSNSVALRELRYSFVQQAGENRSRPIGVDAVVGKGCAITFPIGVPSLSPLFWIILCLRDSRKDHVEGISPPIKNACGRQSEFLAGCERRKLFGVFDCPIVGQNLEDAIVDGSCIFLEFALPNRPALSVFIILLAVLGVRCLRIRGGPGGLLGLLLLRQHRRNGDR